MTTNASRAAAAGELALGLALLTAFWGAGAALAAWLPGVPLPGSLWGMLLLFAALRAGLLPEARVRRAAALLVRWLGLLFVPVGVGVAAYGELVARNLVALTVAIGVGSLLTLVVAGVVARALLRSEPA
jgi:holin-like protein